MAADLYAIADKLQRADRRRFRNVYFEERANGALVFDTYPAKLFVERRRNGKFLVEFSWRYRTQWDEYESVEIEVGEYKSAARAVRRAMELALLSEQDIKNLFEQD